MSTVVNQIRHGFYLDSVALMRMSVDIARLPGVEDAVLMIGSESNRQIMEAAGLLAEQGRSADSNDLVIAVRADSSDAAQDALRHAAQALEGSARAAAVSEQRPRSLSGALSDLPQCNLVLISTPGEFAVREARAALASGRNVMIFSDNVSIEDEKALKQQAAAQGLLVMGPDCGTAYIAGTPLAFANLVPDGDIGVIAASGTGLQEFAVLVSRLGHGIRHGIGVGGRDMSDHVGGLSTLAAIELLASDERVAKIVLISKPPGRQCARAVFERLARCGKPVVACVFGLDKPDIPGSIEFASTLTQAAELSCRSKRPQPDIPEEELASALAEKVFGKRTRIRGLFCGGTLCTEAQSVLNKAGLITDSNAPLPGISTEQGMHVMTDLGADEYTVGRPHPMIDPEVRRAPLEQALCDDDVAVVLLDVVLGLGAHQDPAASVAQAVAAAPQQRPVVIASICGTDRDPQGYDYQRRQLIDAGVIVAASNADAASLAAAIAIRCVPH